ncbi:hypothetical protein RRF57_013225 [Xylaria bambusicola]|uniref:C2H2-type domain-containing protein n=1 Tax=Xylaria bambusicola TaxID=326684 RepID=A0AAN7URE0_9PEZI
MLFCDKILQTSDWKAQYLRITIQILYNFLRWHLNQTTGKGGRQKKCTSKGKSLVTFWCMFRLAFQRAHGFKINKVVDCDKITNAIANLQNDHALDHNTRENRSMTLQDLKDQIEATLKTTEKSFKLGELRILAVLFLLLLAPQGARPHSILKLRFGDLQLFLVRDPTDVNGSPRLVIRLAMHYTKRYLGPKATKFFHIPEIIYDPSLLLSPHVFLLAILFKHRAFLSDGLNNNPDSLHKLQIYPGAKQLRLALKPEIEEKFIFRAPLKEFRGFRLSERSLPYSSMNQWIRRIGILLGFQNNTLCYSLRYMAGNNLDQSVNISDALRNLVMDHAPGSETFQKHYLNRNVVADLWAIHRSEEPQYALLQQATSHGHSKEVRRPIDLTPEQRKMAVAEDPEYQQLTKEQLSLPTGPKFAEERRKLTLSRANLRMKLRNRALEKLRFDWDSAQSVDDIEQQIRGADFSALPEVQPRSCRPMGPLHQAMFDAITMPLDDKSNALVQRKINAINALIAYCDVQEPPMITLIDSRHHAASQREAQDKGKGKGKAQDQVQDNWEEDLKKSVSAHGMGGGDNVRKCFICVALALTMSPTEPAFNKLCHDFYSKLGLQRHFTNTHLSKVKENDETECPFCKITLRNKMYLQNHAEVIHGIKTPKKRGMK